MRVIPVPRVLSFLQRSKQTHGLVGNNSKSYSTDFTTREFEEIQISVPWGHIAGKWYGSKDKRPIIGLHGWQDNAGTYDTLAPLLPPNVSFLAIDLPGHGLSSWLPDGCSYYSIDHLNILFRLMHEFKWEKISMICHSMSALDGFMFASYFPDKCDFFVSLDLSQPILAKGASTVDFMVGQFEANNKQIEISAQKTNPPCYGMDELIERQHKPNRNSISKECCEFILKRNIKPSQVEPNKYYLSRDGRLKSMMFSVFAHDDAVEMAQRIKCPHLFIKSQRAKHFDSDLELEEIMRVFEKNPAFENHLVDGTHHVHLNEPQKIAAILNPFLNKYRLGE